MSFNGVFELLLLSDSEVEVILRGCVSRSLYFLYSAPCRLIKHYLMCVTYYQHLFSL